MIESNACTKGEVMRIWARLFKDNRILKDTVVEDYSEDTRTHKVFHALDEVCLRFDLQRPIWLDVNLRDFKARSRTRFTKDSFTEQVDFDYMEFRVLEDDL